MRPFLGFILWILLHNLMDYKTANNDVTRLMYTRSDLYDIRHAYRSRPDDLGTISSRGLLRFRGTRAGEHVRNRRTNYCYTQCTPSTMNNRIRMNGQEQNVVTITGHRPQNRYKVRKSIENLGGQHKINLIKIKCENNITPTSTLDVLAKCFLR